MSMHTIWDYWAERYERLWIQRAILGPTRELVHRRFGELGLVPGRLLDVGCGIGQFSAEMAARYPACTIVACDTSRRMVEKARARVPAERVSVRLGSLDMAAQEAAFDVIVCLHVLPYLPDPAAALRAMRALLKPDGRLFVVHANGETPYDRLLLAGVKRLVSRADYLSTVAERRLMGEAGLTVREVIRLPVWRALPSIHLVEATPAIGAVKPCLGPRVEQVFSGFGH
jgi:2-polyprenyl-3-methyl-5-hydroxy-6-metoxy-1,4-benzoquinol methylase